MASRRDFLRTLVVSSGAVFAGLPLSCSDDSQVRKKEINRFAGNGDSASILPDNQFYELAHKYIREKHPAPQSSVVTRKCDVAIIGAGPSGLTAAMHLKRAGYDVLVIENEHRAGGAAVGGEYNGLRYPYAAIYFVDYNEDMKDVCGYAGVEPIAAPPDSVLYNKQKIEDYWQDASIRQMPVPKNELDILRRFRDDILAMDEIPSYPLPESLSPQLAQYDAMTVAEYMKKYQSDFLRKFVNLYTRSSMGGSIDETNVYCFLNFYSSEIGKDARTPRYTLDGGMSGLSRPLSEKIGNDRFLFGHLCYRAEQSQSGVHIQTINREGRRVDINARQCIFSTQKYMLPAVIPQMPSAQKTAIASMKYSPYLTVHLCSDNPNLLTDSSFDTWTPEAEPYFTDYINPRTIFTNPASKATVASLYVPQSADDRGSLQSDEVIVSKSRKAAQKFCEIHNRISPDDIHEIHAFAWGHSIVIPGVGSHNGIAQAASRSIGTSIHFAHTDNDSAPAIENAVVNGSRVAEKIITFLNA
ncbi:MAG: FAD-dependent oxidoreductase [Candidatus Kapabacteria bacterium]|nr:FAD-dependent oxidoreductase [Candidatus Kapabacteria bacterium]